MDDIKTEDILKHLEEAKKKGSSVEKKETKRQDKSVLRFIKEMGVSAGDSLFPNHVIYYAYHVLWTGHSRRYKVSKIEFFRTFNQHYTQVRWGKQRHYKLSESWLKLTEDLLESSKNYDEKRKKQVQKKNRSKQKKECKVSSPK